LGTSFAFFADACTGAMLAGPRQMFQNTRGRDFRTALD
jgi:hypothetical protein